MLFLCIFFCMGAGDSTLKCIILRSQSNGWTHATELKVEAALP